MAESVSNFMAITSADEKVAKRFLDGANGQLEVAIANYYVSMDQEGKEVADPAAPPPVPNRGGRSKPVKVEDDDWVAIDEPAPKQPFKEKGKEEDVPKQGEGAIDIHEPEREIPFLLDKYRKDIDYCKEKCKDISGPEHDDIYFLRYCLSFEPSARVEAIRWAITWRREPKNAFYLSLAEEQEKGTQNDVTKEDQGINISSYHKGLKDGGPLQIVRPGLVDFGFMLDINSFDRMVMFHVMQKEVAFKMCDEQTRKTGRLVKLVVINDFTAMKMSMPPKKVLQTFSESSKIAEKLYPQMLQTTVCCNPPTWFSMVMKVGKLFMSAKTLDKFKLCPRVGTIDDCPFVKKYMNKDDIPSFLGGECRCEHQKGCVAGLNNDTKTMRVLTKDEQAKMKAEMKDIEKFEQEKWEEFKKTYKPPK